MAFNTLNSVFCVQSGQNYKCWTAIFLYDRSLGKTPSGIEARQHGRHETTGSILNALRLLEYGFTCMNFDGHVSLAEVQRPN